MNGVGWLSKPAAECHEGAPTSFSSRMKRLWWRYSSSAQRTTPPARIVLVVLLCAQIMFLAIVRLGPSTSLWANQGRSVQVSSLSHSTLSRSSIFLSGMSMGSRAFSDKESQSPSELSLPLDKESKSSSELSSPLPKKSSPSPKKRSHRKEKRNSKQKATTKKMLLKEHTRLETEKTSNVAHSDLQKGSGEAQKEVEGGHSGKDRLDEFLPSVDDKFPADTAIKESFSAQSNTGDDDSLLDTSVKKEGKTEEGSSSADDTSYLDTSFLSMKKAQTNSGAKRKLGKDAPKIKQVVSETDAQAGQDPEKSGESTSNNEEDPQIASEKEDQSAISKEKGEEPALDTSAESRATKQELLMVGAEETSENVISLSKVAEEEQGPEKSSLKGEKVEETAIDTSENTIKVAEEKQGPRDSEKEQQALSAEEIEEAAIDVSTESKEAQPSSAAESATSVPKAAEEVRSVEEMQAPSEEKESKQGSVKEEAVPSEQKVLDVMSSSECSHGYIYVYDLPPAFNRDVISNCTALNPWHDVCATLSNGGLGELLEKGSPLGQEGSWYASDQFTAEIVFHNRILQHACLTDKMELASAFYVPFYAGLDVGRYLISGASAESRDRLSNQFTGWLIEQPAWKKSSGLDHFMMVGRITWDFRRSIDGDWGSGFFLKPAMQNVTKLLIERDPWDNKEMGVPYPTNFHPQSDADLVAWQNHIRKLKRNSLFSFAGTARDRVPNDFRRILFEQCSQAEQCQSLDCSNGTCDDNQKTLEFFMDSTFCLQPRGDSFTRRSTFDCLLAGSIPVFFWHRSAYMQYEWHLPADEGSYSVFISRQDVRNGTRIEDVLKAIAPEKVQSMQEAAIRLIPKIVYAVSGFAIKEKDAFDVAIEGVMSSLKGTKVSSQ